MGNGQNIIDKIIADANAEAQKIESAARAEAEKTVAAAMAKAEKESLRMENIGKDEADKTAAKEISSAQMKAKQMILAAKQKCIEKTVEEAKKQLKELSDAEYKVVILNMIVAAKAEKDSEVILSKEDKEAFGKDIEKLGFTVSEETRPIDGGFVIKNGDIEYNYSFESIISVEKEEIDQAAAKILFA
jgi:V/A-type H+-transporting ATPase subunit E